MARSRKKDDGISINEYLRDEYARLERFKEYWERERVARPESFPERLPLGEWDEQYRLWDDR